MWEKAQEEVIDSQGKDIRRKLSPAGHSPLDGGHLHQGDGLLRRQSDLLLLGRLCGSLLLRQVCNGCTSAAVDADICVYATAGKAKGFVALLSPTYNVIFLTKREAWSKNKFFCVLGSPFQPVYKRPKALSLSQQCKIILQKNIHTSEGSIILTVCS